MKQSSKIALGVAAGAAALVLLKKKKESSVSGIGAIHYTIVGKVLEVKYRNTSTYGNNSYWVILDTGKSYREIEMAYTASNSQLGYTIHSMIGKTVGFDVTQRRDGSIVLNSVASGYDTYGNKK